MKFIIRVKYRTGDSFNTYDDERILAPVWFDNDDAMKALVEIYEFNEFYNAYNNERWTPAKQEMVKDLASRRPWAKDEEDPFDFFSSMNIHHSDGRIKIDMDFVTGYFEIFDSAEIEVKIDKTTDYGYSNGYDDLVKKYGNH